MTVNVHNLIAAIVPDIYCDPSVRGQVKRIAKEEGYLKAAEKAKPVPSDYMDLEETFMKNPFTKPGHKNPIEKHNLIYDAFGGSLEPLYFWILDYMDKEAEKTAKLVDSFIASPGSSYFAEQGGRATRMQEEAMKMLGAANQVIKSILNIIYDLKEFKLRLEVYDGLNSEDKNKKSAARISAKQVWMDTVDLKKGNSSIKALAVGGGPNFVTLIDAFMVANSLEDVKKLDLNERVRRILEQRVSEFLRWIDESERELRKRFEIEKSYLRSQVSTVQLYARWAKPYLKAAHALEQTSSPSAALVNSFNTVIMELTLLGEWKDETIGYIGRGELPRFLKDAKRRAYYPLVIVDITFRTAPERASQGGYGFRGRLEADFTSYALNEDEIKVLKAEIEKDDFGDVMKLIEGATSESLNQIQIDIDEFLSEKEKEEKKEKSAENPFSALASIFKFKKQEKKEGEKSISLKPDSDIETGIRSFEILEARKECRKLYDSFKKVHGMPAF